MNDKYNRAIVYIILAMLIVAGVCWWGLSKVDETYYGQRVDLKLRGQSRDEGIRQPSMPMMTDYALYGWVDNKGVMWLWVDGKWIRQDMKTRGLK